MNETEMNEVIEMANKISTRCSKTGMDEKDKEFIESIFSPLAVRYATSQAGSKTSILKKLTSAQNGAKGGRKKRSWKEKIVPWKSVDEKGIVRTKIRSFQKTYLVENGMNMDMDAELINQKTNEIALRLINENINICLYWEIIKIEGENDKQFFTIAKRYKGKEEKEYEIFIQEEAKIYQRLGKIVKLVSLTKKETCKYLNSCVYFDNKEEELSKFEKEKPINLEPKFIINENFQCFLSVYTLPEQSYPAMLWDVIKKTIGNYRCVIMYQPRENINVGEGHITFQLWSENEEYLKDKSYRLKKEIEKEGFGIKENSLNVFGEWKGMFPGNYKENIRRVPMELLNYIHLIGL